MRVKCYTLAKCFATTTGPVRVNESSRGCNIPLRAFTAPSRGHCTPTASVMGLPKRRRNPCPASWKGPLAHRHSNHSPSLGPPDSRSGYRGAEGGRRGNSVQPSRTDAAGASTRVTGCKRRWADDEADDAELSLEHVRDLLVSVGLLPYHETNRDAFSRVVVEGDSHEILETADAILNEGLTIGQSRRGRGGLSSRLQSGALRRGGVLKYQPPRPVPRVCITHASTIR